MEHDLFTNLPLEMKLEILSRLSIGSVFKCKLVDQSWRSMIESPEFTKSYKSAPCLAASERVKPREYSYKVYDVEDGDQNSKNSCKKAFSFSFPHPVQLYTSVNGLLFMVLLNRELYDVFICNPVTREYIPIPNPPDTYVDSFGFGVSRKSGQFKVVRMCDRQNKKGETREGCQVYTLGTGLWRSVAIAPSSRSIVHGRSMMGKFLNGNIHWLAHHDLDYSQWKISCFDLETELFTVLHAPHLGDGFVCSLRSLRDCLAIGDFSSYFSSGDEIVVIWLMKDYGDEKSWTKEFVIPTTSHDYILNFYHVFKDGDILLLLGNWSASRTVCYSNKTKAIEETHFFRLLKNYGSSKLVLYTPSFRPLKTFSSTENVISF